MPSIVRDPTTHMPGIRFGVVPSSAMSNVSGASSTPASSTGECRECRHMRREGHRHARDPKFCPKHQCTYKDSHSGALCTTRKRGAEPRCPTHTRCKARGCTGPRTVDATGIFTEYCVDHTCVVVTCDEGRVHDPSHGTYKDMCATHLPDVCKIPDCIRWKARRGNFCEQHICEIDGCEQKNLSESDRPFCIEHNKCDITGCQKPKCQFGSNFEAVCGDHFIPPCLVEGCRKKSSHATQFCDLHSCRYTSEDRCENEARPGRGKPFCNQHKCSDHDCQNLKSFNEFEGTLRMKAFCLEHECRKNNCAKHKVPEKPYCNTHCCSNQDCSSLREHDSRFGSLCLHHHEEQVANRAIEEAAIRLREEQEAADRAEADARRRARTREEELRERERRRQPAPDRPRRPEARRPARSPPRQRYPAQEGLRPRPGPAFENRHEDEGYRSNRNSGGSFTTGDAGW